MTIQNILYKNYKFIYLGMFGAVLFARSVPEPDADFGVMTDFAPIGMILLSFSSGIFFYSARGLFKCSYLAEWSEFLLFTISQPLIWITIGFILYASIHNLQPIGGIIVFFLCMLVYLMEMLHPFLVKLDQKRGPFLLMFTSALGAFSVQLFFITLAEIYKLLSRYSI